MFASPPVGKPILTWKLAPFARLVLPSVAAENTGLNASAPQPCAWNGDDTAAEAPWKPDSVPVMLCGAQLVGFRMNPGRLISVFTVLSRNWTPSFDCGNGSVMTVTWAVDGLIRILARMTSLPRLNGPAFAGTTMLKPNGAP